MSRSNGSESEERNRDKVYEMVREPERNISSLASVTR